MMRGESIPNRARSVQQHGDGRLQPFGGDRAGHHAQRQVRRDQGDAQVRRRQHHYRAAGAGARGQPLGVTGEGDAGGVDRALLHGRGDQRAAVHADAQLHAALQLAQHVAGVAWIEPPGPDGSCRRHRQHLHDARPVGKGGGGVVKRLHRHRQTHVPNPLREYVRITQKDQPYCGIGCSRFRAHRIASRRIHRHLPHREHGADVRTDACGLSGGDG